MPARCRVRGPSPFNWYIQPQPAPADPSPRWHWRSAGHGSADVYSVLRGRDMDTGQVGPRPAG